MDKATDSVSPEGTERKKRAGRPESGTEDHPAAGGTLRMTHEEPKQTPAAAASKNGDNAPSMEATRAEIEHLREEMEGTIQAIKEKLSPHHLAEQAKESVRDAATARARQVVSTVTSSGSSRAASCGIRPC